MNAKPNTVDQSQNQYEESTYALLIRSEEKSRNVIEMAIYPLLILGAIIAIWQFAQQPINIPPARVDTGCVVCVDESDTAGSWTFGNQRIEKSSELAETW